MTTKLIPTLNQIRISVDDTAEFENLAYALENKGVACSFQWNGEVDEKECKIMELRPIGHWKYYHDVMNNDWVFEQFKGWE